MYAKKAKRIQIWILKNVFQKNYFNTIGDLNFRSAVHLPNALTIGLR